MTEAGFRSQSPYLLGQQDRRIDQPIIRRIDAMPLVRRFLAALGDARHLDSLDHEGGTTGCLMLRGSADAAFAYRASCHRTQVGRAPIDLDTHVQSLRVRIARPVHLHQDGRRRRRLGANTVDQGIHFVHCGYSARGVAVLVQVVHVQGTHFEIPPHSRSNPSGPLTVIA